MTVLSSALFMAMDFDLFILLVGDAFFAVTSGGGLLIEPIPPVLAHLAALRSFFGTTFGTSGTYFSILTPLLPLPRLPKVPVLAPSASFY